LHVGDSLALGSDPPLRQLLPAWAITTDALKNRTTAVGVAIIDRQPALPDALVVELGTNDSPDRSAQFAASVRHVLQLAGPNRCVVWVNIHRPPYNGVTYDGFNTALDQIAATSDNLAVVDWNGMVNSGHAAVAGDDVHATAEGYQARASAIAQALQGCSSPRSSGGSHTIAPAKKRKPAAGPRPRAAPKPKPATKPKAIKVYTPQPRLGTSEPEITRSTSDGGGSVWPYLVGGLAVVALAAGGYVLVRRRRVT
jgi:hypothetical protein